MTRSKKADQEQPSDPPPTNAERAALKIYPPEVEGRGNETILIVDDDELIRKFVGRVLGGCGYAVLSAASPAEALRLCAERRESIDLMLTDVVMPGMLGDELALRLEAARPDMKVIFMSGCTEESIVQRAVKNGAAFIQKPMTLELLVRRVREVLDAPGKNGEATQRKGQERA